MSETHKNEINSKLIANGAKRFTPQSRFEMGMLLATIYHRNGKLAFAQNCLALGMDGDAVAAMLVELAKPSNVPLRPGYTPEELEQEQGDAALQLLRELVATWEAFDSTGPVPLDSLMERARLLVSDGKGQS